MATPRLTLPCLVYSGLLIRALATGGVDSVEPQTLDYYLQRLPAKSIVQVLNDQGLVCQAKAQSVIDVQELKNDFAAGPSPALVKKIDQLLVQARDHHASATELNLLQDLRDLAGGEGTPKEIGEYLDWRFSHLDWFSRKETTGYWEKPALKTNGLDEINQKITSSSAALLPHWIYLKGAYYYKQWNDTDSEACFDKILKDFPNDARAETALFMKARCRLSQSSGNQWGDSQDKINSDTRDDAKKLFQQYLTKYPKGRYLNDVLGWLGGAAYRSGNFAEAVSYYIQQIENKQHPEDVPAAVVMIEKCLYHLRDTSSPDIDHIALHPAVALAMTYFAVNSASESNGYFTFPNSSDTSAEDVKKWRSEVLPKLATAVLAEKDHYRGQLGQNRYFAILAQAASDQGHQDEALKLLKLGNKKEANDDFAFVQALVYQRAGKLSQAVDAYRDFLKRFSSSPLARGAQYRMALALHDLHKDGDALLELAALRGNHIPFISPQNAGQSLSEPPPDTISAISVDYSGSPDPQIDQTMDALLNFAPLSSLATALKGDDKDHEQFRTELKWVLRERALAHEDFKSFAAYGGQFSDEQAVQIGDLIDATSALTGNSKATNSFEIAEHWQDGPTKYQLVSPLDDENTRGSLFQDNDLNAASYRKSNGSSLSFTNSDQELEARNAWTHSMAWWQASIQADPASSSSPTALWKTITAQRKTVEISPYTQQRAIERKAQEQVRQQYDELIKNYPDSEEAKKYAVFWNFPTQEEINKANGNYDTAQLAYLLPGRWEREAFLENFFQQLHLGSGLGYSGPGSDSDWKAVCDDLGKLPDTVNSMDQKGLQDQVSAILQKAKSQATDMGQMAVINCLEDLKQLAQLPPIDPETRDRYIRLRLSILCASELSDIGYGSSIANYQCRDDELHNRIQEFADDPKSKPILDFVDFLELALIANHMEEFSTKNLYKPSGEGQWTYSDRDYPLLASKAEVFLLNHPQSLKRESAMVLRLRGLDLASRIKTFSNTIPWPQANSWAGDPAPVSYQRVPLDSTAFEKVVSEYNKEFPNGSNRNAVLSYRADVALWRGDWGEFLDRITKLKDQGGAEFHEQIVNELSSFFDKLDDDSLRATLLDEILKRPKSRDILKTYINAGGLPYLKDYLIGRISGS